MGEMAETGVIPSLAMECLEPLEAAGGQGASGEASPEAGCSREVGPADT